MSFPHYPKYKDSGVEWLGAVPEHWRLSPLRHLVRDGFDGLKIGPFGSQLTSEMLDPVGAFKVYGQENVIASDFDRGGRFIDADKFNELSVYEITPGDLLITMMGTSGRCAVVPHELAAGIMDSHLLRIRVGEGVRPELVRLLIDEAPYVDQQVRLMGKGSIMHGLNSSIVKALLLVIPPPEEQRAILDFLHRETDKIDALVTEQQRLIVLLKEKLQTVISRAVIKGLTPDAPMTPSGVEWLGDVPTCWKVMPLKWACSLIKDGTHLPPSRVDIGVPLLSVRNIVDGEFVLRDDDSLISRESYDDLCHSFAPRATDVLLAIVGATLGKTAVIPEGIGSFQIQRSLAVFRPSPSVLISKFLHLLFRSGPFQSFLWEQVGFSAQPGIYLGTLQDVHIPVPSVGEQSKIASHLEQTTREFDGLIIEAKRAIALLQERRTAVISAAVTGKIDVRGLVDAAEAA